MPNQSCISFVNGATTFSGSGMWPRSLVAVCHVSKAARRRFRADWWMGFLEVARFFISCGSRRVSYSISWGKGFMRSAGGPVSLPAAWSFRINGFTRKHFSL